MLIKIKRNLLELYWFALNVNVVILLMRLNNMLRIVEEKRMGMHKPVERKRKPLNSLKTGEIKTLKHYVCGNRQYYVKKS